MDTKALFQRFQPSINYENTCNLYGDQGNSTKSIRKSKYPIEQRAKDLNKEFTK